MYLRNKILIQKNITGLYVSVAERRIAIEMEVFLHLKKFRLLYKLFKNKKKSSN